MSFLWPTSVDPSPGAFARLGRVIHWIGLLLAAIVFCIVVVDMFDGADASTFWFGAPFAACLYLAARGLRYILAAE